MSARQPRLRSELIALLAGRNFDGLCAGRPLGLMLCGRDSCPRGDRLSVDGVRLSSQWAEPDEMKMRIEFGSSVRVLESMMMRSRTDSCRSPPPAGFRMEIDGVQNVFAVDHDRPFIEATVCPTVSPALSWRPRAISSGVHRLPAGDRRRARTTLGTESTVIEFHVKHCHRWPVVSR